MSKNFDSLPTTAQLEAELERSRKSDAKTSFSPVIAAVYAALTIMIAAAVLVYFFPALKITGNAMNPSLESGDIIVAARFSEVKKGDIGLFRFGNKIMVKRMVAAGGEIVNIDGEGNLSINRTIVEEPYIKNKALGQYDLDPDFEVPAGCGFFMGDNRTASIDSRLSRIGCPDDDQIIGRVVLRVWPLGRFGTLKKAP